MAVFVTTTNFYYKKSYFCAKLILYNKKQVLYNKSVRE